MPRKKSPPPVRPPGPDQTVFVNRGSKPHFRKKRGTMQPAALNPAMQTQAAAVKLSMPAASRMIGALAGHFEGMKKGSLQAKIGLRMAKELREQGFIDYHTLAGVEAQPAHAFSDLINVGYRVEYDAGTDSVIVHIPIPAGKAVKVRGSLVSGVQFTAILLSGHPLDAPAFHLEEAVSALYPVSGKAVTCTLSIPMPDEGPWMLWLKAICMEGNEPGLNPKYRVMKVVKTGAF